MTARVASLHTLGDATVQLPTRDATCRATGATSLSPSFPMTASELRAQLRVQQARNSAVRPCNSEAEKVASVAGPAQATELRRLVALLFGGDTDAHQAEALAAALADPYAALMSFRTLAVDLGGFANHDN